MFIDFLNAVDDYIEMYNVDIREGFYAARIEDEAFIAESSIKHYFATYLRDVIRTRGYFDGITIEGYLRKFMKYCLENCSAYPEIEDRRVIMQPRTMWSLGFEVAESFSDFCQYIYWSSEEVKQLDEC